MALLWKMICDLGHPVSLRHPVGKSCQHIRTQSYTFVKETGIFAKERYVFILRDSTCLRGAGAFPPKEDTGAAVFPDNAAVAPELAIAAVAATTRILKSQLATGLPIQKDCGSDFSEF